MRLEDFFVDAPHLLERLPTRFWSKVEIKGEDDCWPWKASTCGHGKARLEYGRFAVRDGRIMTAHRVAYFLTHGEIDDSLFACHSCDNPPCCNPAHLFAGTGKDNAADRDGKGRYVLGHRVRGEDHYRTTLVADEVRHIIRAHRNGVPPRVLADLYSVSRSTIQRIVAGKTWRHIAASEIVSAKRKLARQRAKVSA